MSLFDGLRAVRRGDYYPVHKVDAILAKYESNKKAIPYCYTVEQKNGLSQGAMCRSVEECQASPLFDPNNYDDDDARLLNNWGVELGLSTVLQPPKEVQS